MCLLLSLMPLTVLLLLPFIVIVIIAVVHVCLQHPGVGIDLRKRNIWDTYGPDVHLEVIIN